MALSMATVKRCSEIGAVLLSGESSDLAGMRARLGNATAMLSRQAEQLNQAHQLHNLAAKLATGLQGELESCKKELSMTRSECQELMFANQNLERMSAKEETRLKEEEAKTNNMYIGTLETLSQLQQQHQDLTVKHQDFVFYSTPSAVVEDLQEQVERLTDKLERRAEKYQKLKSNYKSQCEDILHLRAENKDIQQVVCDLKTQMTRLCVRFGVAQDAKIAFIADSLASSPRSSVFGDEPPAPSLLGAYLSSTSLLSKPSSSVKVPLISSPGFNTLKWKGDTGLVDSAVSKHTPRKLSEGRPALASLTNKLTSWTASASLHPIGTPVKRTSATSPTGLQLSAVGLSSDLLRIRARTSGVMTSTHDIDVTKGALADTLARSSSFSFSGRSSGSQASPGTPPGCDFMSPARALCSRQKVFARDDTSSDSQGFSARAVGSSLRPLASHSPISGGHEAGLLGSTSPAPVPFSPTPSTKASIADSMATAAGNVSPVAAPPQLTPLQMPGQRIDGHTNSKAVRSAVGHRSRTPSSHASCAGSNSTGRGALYTNSSPVNADRRSSAVSSIATRPAWSSCYTRSPGLQPSPAVATSASTCNVTTGHTGFPTTLPSPLNTVSTTATASSTQAIRRTAKASTAARLLSTAKTGPVTTVHGQSSVADAAQPKVQRSGRSNRPAVQGASRSTRLARQTAGFSDGQTSVAARKQGRRLPADMPILADSAFLGQAATTPAVTVLVQGGPSAIAEAQQSRKGLAAKKIVVPTRIQPVRQVNQWKS